MNCCLNENFEVFRKRNTILTEKRRLGLKNEVRMIFVSFDIHNDFKISSRT